MFGMLINRHIYELHKSALFWSENEREKKSLGTFQDASLLPFYLMFSALFYLFRQLKATQKKISLSLS